MLPVGASLWQLFTSTEGIKMKKTIQGTVCAYLSEHAPSVDTLMGMDAGPALGRLIFYPADAKVDGWTPVGTAYITVEFNDDKEVLNAQVDSLKQQQKKVQAEAEVKVNELQSRINSLLCLEYIPREDN